MKGLITHNFGLKLLSVGLAIVLWYMISAKGTSEVSLVVPIEYINIPQGYEIIKKGQDRVNISVYGSERAIASIRPDDIRVFVDLSGATAGLKKYRIQRNRIRKPSSVEVASVNPSEVEVFIDKIIRKDLRVIPVISNSRGLKERMRVEVIPETVTAEGPETLLKGLNTVKTEPIKITFSDEPVVKTVGLIAEGDKIRLSVEEVKLRIYFENNK
jgi:YbbR domain-containing protein